MFRFFAVAATCQGLVQIIINKSLFYSMFNDWMNGENIPTSGSLLKLLTSDGNTRTEIVAE